MREPIDFAEGKRRRLKAFDRFVIDLCRIAPIKHVACFLDIGWDMIKAIFKGHLALRLQKRKLNKVRYIAVDEFATRKGHHYMTLVIDLEAGAVLYAHEALLKSLLLQVLYSVRSNRLLVEQLGYNALYRWFLGLSLEELFMLTEN